MGSGRWWGIRRDVCRDESARNYGNRRHHGQEALGHAAKGVNRHRLKHKEAHEGFRAVWRFGEPRFVEDWLDALASLARRRVVRAHVHPALAQLIQHLGQTLLANISALSTRDPRKVFIALMGGAMVIICAQTRRFERALDIFGHLDGLALEPAVLVTRINLAHVDRLQNETVGTTSCSKARATIPGYVYGVTEKRARLTKAAIVRVAVAYLDSHSVEELTLRALGEELEAHHTALFRHFKNKNELVVGMFGFVVDEVLDQCGDLSQLDPRSRIEMLALTFRTVLHRHPALVHTIVSGPPAKATLPVVRAVVASLEEMGVPEGKQADYYQLLETHVFGSSTFDFAGAPHHLTSRQERHSSSGLSPLVAASKSVDDIDELNERVFALGLRIILDSAQQF